VSARRHPLRSVALGLVILWSIVPIYWAARSALQTESAARSRPVEYIPLHPTLNNFRTLLLGQGDVAVGIRHSLLNIVIECTAATAVTVTLAALAAYAFARFTFRGRNVLFYTVLATMAFPPNTTLIPLYRIMSDFGLVNTYTGIVLVYVSGFLPLAVWVLHNYSPASRRASRRPAESTAPAACRCSGTWCYRWQSRESSRPLSSRSCSGGPSSSSPWCSRPTCQLNRSQSSSRHSKGDT